MWFYNAGWTTLGETSTVISDEKHTARFAACHPHRTGCWSQIHEGPNPPFVDSPITDMVLTS